MRTVLAAALVASLAPAGAGPALAHHTAEGPPAFAIRGVRVFDGEKAVEGLDVLVEHGEIAAVGRGLAIPEGVETIDGAGRTLLPGLIDAHIHVWDAAQLEQSLAFGVTTGLDMFSVPETVKRFKEENLATRADLRSAGTLATAPGGHGTEYGIPIPTLSKPEEAAAFVDARFAEGSDYLKIVLDGGAAYGRTIPTLDAATVKALVDAAHARKRLAVVHVGTYAEAKTAIESGADGIVHLFRDRAPDPGFAAMVKRRGAFVTPTLAVLRTLQGVKTAIAADPALAPFLDPAAKNNLAATFGLHSVGEPGVEKAAIAGLRDAGVPILAGTDSPNPGTTHGASLHDELALLVDAGLTPSAALAGATSLPARIFGLTDRGRIANGLRADLLLVDGDPTRSIADSRRIVEVWRAGARLDRAAFRARVAEATAKAAAAPPAPPELAESGKVSDFEDGTPDARFGQPWSVSTDAMMGGKSTVELAVVDGGAETPAKALELRGEVVAGGPTAWAGAIFSPGARPFTATDLSAKGGVSFFARGDGRTYTVMVFAAKRGRMPSVRTFTAGPEYGRVAFTWADFDGLDGGDVLGIFIGASEAGKFELRVDDVELR